MLPLPPATAVSAAGYMLETPSIRRYSPMSRPLQRIETWEVKTRPVRSISRKDSGIGLRILRDHTPAISALEMKIWSGPHGDVGRSAEMTGPPIEKSCPQQVHK